MTNEQLTELLETINRIASALERQVSTIEIVKELTIRALKENEVKDGD